MLIAGPISAAPAYIWMALGHDASLVVGVFGPMVLLAVSFAALVAPLTASILSTVGSADEGRRSIRAPRVNHELTRHYGPPFERFGVRFGKTAKVDPAQHDTAQERDDERQRGRQKQFP
jgi:hypothetical protein